MCKDKVEALIYQQRNQPGARTKDRGGLFTEMEEIFYRSSPVVFG